jgi:deoxyuridine 5'-triphosphate nucleotidohydrolase
MIKIINNWIKMLVHSWLFSYDYDICIQEGGKLPLRTYKRDAGYDLFVSKSVTVSPGEGANVSVGVSVRSRIPAWILLTNRSSTLMRYGLIVDSGVIDGDYIGELYIKVFNPTKKDIHIPPDTRIAQIIIMPHTSIIPHYVSHLPIKKGARNTKGFGSSGQ